MRSLHDIREYLQQGADVGIRSVLETLDLRDVVSSCTTHLPYTYNTSGAARSSSSSSYSCNLANLAQTLDLRKLKQELGL